MYGALSQELMDDIHGRVQPLINPRQHFLQTTDAQNCLLTGYSKLRWACQEGWPGLQVAPLNQPAELWLECSFCGKWRRISDSRGPLHPVTALSETKLTLQEAIQGASSGGCSMIGTTCGAVMLNPEADVQDLMSIEVLEAAAPAYHRICVWNRVTKRKISGNAAPMGKNLAEYLRKHPDCELYLAQDALIDAEEKARLIELQHRVPIWNRSRAKKICGNAAPSEKNLVKFLELNPDCEVYLGQELDPRNQATLLPLWHARDAGYQTLYHVAVSSCVQKSHQRARRLSISEYIEEEEPPSKADRAWAGPYKKWTSKKSHVTPQSCTGASADLVAATAPMSTTTMRVTRSPKRSAPVAEPRVIGGDSRSSTEEGGRRKRRHTGPERPPKVLKIYYDRPLPPIVHGLVEL